MNKIYFQGTFGAYSHLAAISIEPKAEIIPCKTFDECFLNASKDPEAKIIIPESNRITGNIGIEYLIFEYRLNIYSEYFQKIEHNLLCLPGTKISEIKDVYSHGQALSQCSRFIKSNKFIEPDKLNIEREDARQHLSFGFGIHRCLGNRLADLQLKILWEEILERFSKIEVTGETEYLNSSFIRGITKLPVQAFRK